MAGAQLSFAHSAPSAPGCAPVARVSRPRSVVDAANSRRPHHAVHSWRVRARTGALLGFVFGMAFFLPTLSWSGVYVGAFPWTALAVLESLYMAALGAAVAPRATSPHRAVRRRLPG